MWAASAVVACTKSFPSPKHFLLRRTVPFTVRGQSLQWYSMWVSVKVSGFFKVLPTLEFLPPSGCVQVSGNVTDNRVLICCGFCAGHINHSIFWNNLAPPKVSISKDLDLLSGTSCLWAESQKSGSWIWPLTEVPANFAGGRRRATRRKSSISYWVTVWILG